MLQRYPSGRRRATVRRSVGCINWRFLEEMATSSIPLIYSPISAQMPRGFESRTLYYTSWVQIPQDVTIVGPDIKMESKNIPTWFNGR